MFVRKLVAIISLVGTCLLFLPNLSSLSANSTTHVIFNDAEVEENSNEIINDHGTLLVPLKQFAELLKFEVVWKNSSNSIFLSYPAESITLKVGSSKVINNGKLGVLAKPVQIIQSQTYVPLRNIAEILGASVTWNNKEKTVIIKTDNIFIKSKETSPSFWWNIKTGQLWQSNSFGISAKEIGLINMKNYFDDHPSINIHPIKLGGVIVTIVNNYGEPNLNFDVSTAFIYNSKIVKQVSATYYYRFEGNIFSYEDLPVITDGKIIYLLNSIGSEIKKITLNKDSEPYDIYSIIAIGKTYVVARSNLSGFLTLFNLTNGTSELLYKKLLSEKEQQYSEGYNQVKGDNLIFDQEKDGKLIFKYHSLIESKDYTYYYNLN